ncbi:MAG: NAD(P)/FAD-dependent oxidoreductase [Caulobacter sp.]|nr:NAD(P)/FAD-dependent oxidoreductase [Caulobacter sp.]
MSSPSSITMPAIPRRAPRVVIVGAGFGGLSAAMGLADTPAEVTLIDRRNHHLFQPLLYQVATAGLSPTQIASPIRTILRRQSNTRVLLAEVTGVSLEDQAVQLDDRRLPFDFLVLATGATHAYFGRDDWRVVAPGLKSLEDATDLRRRVLLAFEKAELEADPDERARLLTFVIIGAGPTGVELAGAIAELARRALTCDFRAIRGAMAQVVLVEGGQRVLPQFSPRLSTYARRALLGLGVDVRLGASVTECDDRGVLIGAQRIESRTVIWAAGVQSSPAARWVAATGDRAGRAIVNGDQSIPNHPNVFVVGDASSAAGPDGRPLPGVAPVAKQQGEHVARLIAAHVRGRPVRRAGFRYRDSGSMATIGRKAAVAALGPVELKGALAWLVWCLAHVWFLIGFRNRIAVVMDWMWAYVTFERGARLITGGPEARPSPAILPPAAVLGLPLRSAIQSVSKS